jgi:hypothetical protein
VTKEKVMVHAYRMAAFAAALAALVPRAVPAAEAPLVLERTIPLPGVAGRIDHMAVDLKRGTLFIGEVGAGALDAIDLKSGRRIGRVEHLKEPQGVAYLEALDQVAVASGGDGAVRFYKAADLAPVGAVQLDGDADNLRVGPDGMLVAADSRGFAVIDPVRRVVGPGRRWAATPKDSSSTAPERASSPTCPTSAGSSAWTWRPARSRPAGARAR